MSTKWTARAGILFGLYLLALVGGCAHSTPTPVAMEPAPPPADLAAYSQVIITTEAASGVFIPANEQEGVVAFVKQELTARAPGRFTFVEPPAAGSSPTPQGQPTNAPEPPKTLRMNILFTEYDKGNAFARFMLAGLGQIRVGSNVKLSDEHTQAALGSYEVSKQFAFGGIYGAVTDMEDVEQGLAKGIAEVLVPTTAETKGTAKAYPN